MKETPVDTTTAFQPIVAVSSAMTNITETLTTPIYVVLSGFGLVLTADVVPMTTVVFQTTAVLTAIPTSA